MRTIPIPTTTRTISKMITISNANSKKFIILSCVDVDESGHRFRLAAEQSENECSQITHNNDRSEERSIPRAAVP
jgi:hypothetical protein